MNDKYDLSSLIENGKLVRGCYPDRDTFFTQISRQLYAEEYVDADFCQAIIDRENEYPTGLIVPSGEISIPHVREQYVKKDAVIVALFNDPIQFYAMDDREKILGVHIAFVLLLTDAKKHLTLLKQLIGVVQAPNLFDLMDVQTKEAALKLLASM